MTLLFVFEFLGTNEVLVIAIVALIIFGPRKLPEIGRKIGRSLAEFKRASEDFKRTWEYEVDIERADRESRIAPGEAVSRPALDEGNDTGADVVSREENLDATAAMEGQTIARNALSSEALADETDRPEVVDSDGSTKKDWL